MHISPYKFCKQLNYKVQWLHNDLHVTLLKMLPTFSLVIVIYYRPHETEVILSVQTHKLIIIIRRNSAMFYWQSPNLIGFQIVFYSLMEHDRALDTIFLDVWLFLKKKLKIVGFAL